MSLGVAFKAFFAALFNKDSAAKINDALSGSPTQAPALEEKPKPAEPKKPAAPARSDALTLLTTLQREARLLDLVQESLDGFEDAQIGAAAREVLRDCRKTLDRMFAIEPLAEQEEGASMQVNENQSPNQIRVVGSGASGSGQITHRGWKATCCEVPKWSGSHDEKWILAPTEVEV